ncbi:MAG: PKD domain-containing protein [Chitinophagales bacterium]|nr:PKD domain-containing protein [Chitinophagales bacterium]
MKAKLASYQKQFLGTIALITIILTSTNAQLVANFSANATTGCAPVLVKFQDASAGNPTSWKWDLGNGTISYQQNPSVTYFTPGTYTIKLIVANSNEQDSVIKTSYLTIYGSPSVHFSADKTNGCYPLHVNFTDLTNTNGDSITSWLWDFNDGNISSSQNPSHTFSQQGGFNIKLSVTTINGCMSVTEKSKFITTDSSLLGGFNYTILSTNCSAPTSVQFNNTSTGSGVLNYQWSFGDGATSNDKNPLHNYTSAGSYTVTLVVSNNMGCTDTIVKNNIVNIGTVQANFTIPDSICVGVKLDLFNTSTPATISCNWSFGNGITSTQTNPSITYNTVGIYTIKLVNNFGACFDSLENTIKVIAKPTANFSALNTLSCIVPLDVQFTNNSMGGDTYQWNFGNGNTSTLQNPTHSFTSFGIYNVSLLVTATNGCSDKIQIDSLIKLIPVKITNIGFTPTEGCVPLTVNMQPTLNTSDSSIQYEWNFGDSTFSTEKNPTHIYTKAGVYTVQLKIINANGCFDSLIINNAVRVGDKPNANFSATPREGCTTTGIQFTDSSTNALIDKWKWSFGDGKGSTMQNPLTTFQDTGWFNVRLIVWSNGCSDTMVKANYIHILPPMANFVFDANNCNEKLKVVFTDSSKGAESYKWYFGDGDSSTLANPVHIYAKGGTYQVILIVYNGECSHSKIRTVTVDDKRGELILSDTVICRNTKIQFSIVNTNAAVSAAYTWHVGEGNNLSSGNLASTNYIYTNAGTFSTWVAINYSNGCTDTLRYNSIKVYGAKANFTAPHEMFCSGTTIHLTDSSLTDGIHNITSWNWSFGDGITEQNNYPNTSHNYTMGGSFKVKLKVIDAFGCTDSIVKNNAINISKSIAAFSSDTLLCPSTGMQFHDASSGNYLSYQWDLGDGTTTTASSPVHQYPNQGIYTIKLIVTDNLGCADTLIKINHVKVFLPKASFLVNDSIANCPPLLVNTTNTSLYAGSSNWSFGNGGISSNTNPSHIYVYPGNYTLQLIVQNTGGCADTASKNIIIHGPTGTFNYLPTIGCNPLTVNFNATTQNSISNTWDFNNGVTNVTTANHENYTYTLPGDYIPKLILEDVNGCRVPIIGKDTIKVKYIQAAMIAPPKAVCDSATLQFKDSSLTNDIITQYVWSFGNGFTSSQANPTYLYNSNGLYSVKLKVTTQAGCTDSIVYNNIIKVISSPKFTVTGDTSVCKNGSLQFAATHTNSDTSIVTWNWNFGNGNIYATQNPPVQHFTSAGIVPVHITLTNSSGCYNTITKTINVHDLPNVNAGADVTICRNQSYTLQATGANTYTWYGNIQTLNNNHIANPVAKPLTTITYAVTGKSIYNCEATDSITITVQQPLKLNVIKGDTICLGQTAKITATGTEQYKWYPSLYVDNINSASVNIKPAKDTLMNYMLLGWDNNNCFTDTAFVKIKTYPIPEMTVEQNDVTVNAGTSFELKSKSSPDITQWKWTPNKYLNNPNIENPTAVAKENITYTVVARNGGNCITRNEVKVTVVCNGGNIFVPNTFSPNGDGMNDVFYPRGKGVYTIKSFRIFNRWGEMVFEKTNFQANDASAAWDGTYKGIKQPADAYVYAIEIMCDNSVSVPSKGSITLLR